MKLPKENSKQTGIKLFSVLFALLALFTVHYALFPNTSFAQAKFDTDLGQFQRALSSGQYNKETFDLQSVIGMSGSLYTLLAGCKSGDANCPQSLRTGAVDKLGETIAGIYAVPPASGVYYASTIFERLSPVKPAYAQEAGTGFRVLGPFLSFWKAVRNMVYVLFALGAVILGVMIMLRTKISPQAVMTVQAALPRLVVGLIVVTFSYAIVGFLIDLTYVVVGVLMWAFNNAGLPFKYNAVSYFNTYSNAGFGETVGTIFQRGIQGSFDLATEIIAGSGVQLVATSLLTAVIATLAVIFPPVGAAIGAGLIPIFLGLAIAVIAFLIGTLFALAKAYLMLLIHLTFGPAFILWGTLSGKGIWEGWLRGVLANLLVFPAIGLLIFTIDVFINLINAAPGVWGPPYLGQQQAVLRGIIALGGLMLLPKVPDIVNQMLNIRPVAIEFPPVLRQLETLSRDITQAYQRARGSRAAGGGTGTIP